MNDEFYFNPEQQEGSRFQPILPATTPQRSLTP
jgi:hypothetical protein